MRSIYEVILHVESNGLGTVLDVVKNAAVVASVRPVEAKHGKKPGGYVNGKRDKGISGEAVALDILKDGKAHPMSEFRDAFEHRGFAPNSASPVLSKLCASKKAKPLGRGVFQKHAT